MELTKQKRLAWLAPCLALSFAGAWAARAASGEAQAAQVFLEAHDWWWQGASRLIATRGGWSITRDAGVTVLRPRDADCAVLIASDLSGEAYEYRFAFGGKLVEVDGWWIVDQREECELGRSTGASATSGSPGAPYGAKHRACLDLYTQVEHLEWSGDCWRQSFDTPGCMSSSTCDGRGELGCRLIVHRTFGGDQSFGAGCARTLAVEICGSDLCVYGG